MIPAEQVKEAVRNEHRQLGVQRRLASSSLPARGGNAHDDVAKERSCAGSVGSLALGKREHVGRAILSAIDPVKFLDLIVVHEDNRELVVCHLKGTQHGPRDRSDPRARDPAVGAALNDDAYGHQRSPGFDHAPKPETCRLAAFIGADCADVRAGAPAV
jgi:hypothetical protein